MPHASLASMDPSSFVSTIPKYGFSKSEASSLLILPSRPESIDCTIFSAALCSLLPGRWLLILKTSCAAASSLVIFSFRFVSVNVSDGMALKGLPFR